MQENSQLHLELIKLKEQTQTGAQDKRHKQLQSEFDDLCFLTSQKDRKINELESQCNEMRQKLSMALQATQIKKATEVQKVFGKEKDVDDYRATFEVTNILPNNSATYGETKKQQEIWA